MRTAGRSTWPARPPRPARARPRPRPARRRQPPRAACGRRPPRARTRADALPCSSGVCSLRWSQRLAAVCCRAASDRRSVRWAGVLGASQAQLAHLALRQMSKPSYALTPAQRSFGRVQEAAIHARQGSPSSCSDAGLREGQARVTLRLRAMHIFSASRRARAPSGRRVFAGGCLPARVRRKPVLTGRAAVDVAPDALGREERRLHRLDPPA